MDTDAEFYVLIRLRHGDKSCREFVSARKRKPEPGLLSTGRDEVWIKVSAYIPIAAFLGASRHDPIGLWGEPLYPSKSELAIT